MLIESVEKEPKKENYRDFLRTLVSGLEIFGQKEIGLMIYGSYVRGDADFGRSDIDGVLIFPGNAAINKKIMMQVSEIIANAQIRNDVPLDFTPVDLTTIKDGRFNPYDPSFQEYFNLEGKILFGPDYRKDFNYEFPTMPDQQSLTANLWISRKALLMSEWHKRTDYGTFKRNFKRTLDKVSRASKQIMGLSDGKLRLNKFSALESVASVFPEVNAKPLEKIKYLYKNRAELYKLYKKPDELMEVWNSSVTFFEQMIKAYLDANPRSQ